MQTIKTNLIPLCVECHRGNTGAHLNKKTDLRLKKNLQFHLEVIFIAKEYFDKEEIKEILECNENEVMAILKKLYVHVEGYRKDDLIIRLLGGRKYI